MAERFRIQRVRDGDTVSAMLERGDLDALIYPETPLGATGSKPTLRPSTPDQFPAMSDPQSAQ